jgi:Domain of unknown function (DUF5664)
MPPATFGIFKHGDRVFLTDNHLYVGELLLFHPSEDVGRVRWTNGVEEDVSLALLSRGLPKADTWKDTNPKVAFADRKVPISALPAPVLSELGLALLEGALKYGRHNWRVSGVRASTYYDAAMRHLMCWWEGEDVDPDSGLPHLVKAMACLVVVRDAELLGKMNDDRPPRHSADWVGILNAKSVALREKYPDPKPPHTEKAVKP